MFARLQEALGGKQKKRLSLAELKALNAVMEENGEVADFNQNLIVESLRSIAEIVIWGDQNDPKVFEYFLEKNMIAYFDNFLGQGAGTFIATQLLQTLMMLLDNINTPTSIWFLLSKNHMNSIITHQFDFNEEEVLAYYISFLKSLSMKLTPDTLLFFHNEHLPNFPLYHEATKLFNHKESMVRVAVRTLTLQVFKAALHNEFTAEFLCLKVPEYFSSLVWVVGNQSIAMDACLRGEPGDPTGSPKVALGQLEAYVAEHLDLFCYMSDVIMLNFRALTRHLSVQLVDSLFIPLYVHSVTLDPSSVREPAATSAAAPDTVGELGAAAAAATTTDDRSIGVVVALYLTAQMLLIFDHPPIVNTVAAAILLGNPDGGEEQEGDVESLSFGIRQMMLEGDRLAGDVAPAAADGDGAAAAAKDGGDAEAAGATKCPPDAASVREAQAQIVRLLDPTYDDVVALQTMVMLHAVMSNQGSYGRILKAAGLVRPEAGCAVGEYNTELITALLWVIEVTARVEQPARLCTLGLAIQLTLTLTMRPPEEIDDDPEALTHPPSVLTPEHHGLVRQVYDFTVAQMSQLYGKYADAGKESRGHFLDLFELETKRIKPIKVPLLMSQASVLLRPSAEQRGNMDFEWRMPHGPDETARRIMQTFFYIRKLWLKVNREDEKQLPLRQPQSSLALRDLVDMSMVTDLIHCTVVSRTGKAKQLVQVRRFMMVDSWRLCLLEAQTAKPGYGLVRFVCDLNHVIACPETHNTRALAIVIRVPNATIPRGAAAAQKASAHTVIFSGRFVFDDHIRCVAAQQYLERGRATLREEKILELEALMGMGVIKPVTPVVASPAAAPAPAEEEPLDASRDFEGAIHVEPDPDPPL
mmetsp:Transcript_35893/g.94082  ORF Transcript_35893/g.94082 Transcript_35893/m.94082 type:complete len:868 (-) Transcript_35893:55-2658(-)